MKAIIISPTIGPNGDRHGRITLLAAVGPTCTSTTARPATSSACGASWAAAPPPTASSWAPSSSPSSACSSSPSA
eukprot:15437371-Heterocapsa_arctica.AAC.1